MFYTLACGSQVQYALPLVKITNSWWMVTKGLLFSAAVCYLWFERATVDKRLCIAATMRRHCCEPRRSGCAREGASFFSRSCLNSQTLCKKRKRGVERNSFRMLIILWSEVGMCSALLSWWQEPCFLWGCCTVVTFRWILLEPYWINEVVRKSSYTHIYNYYCFFFFCLNKSVSLTQFLSQ